MLFQLADYVNFMSSADSATIGGVTETATESTLVHTIDSEIEMSTGSESCSM